ncbi:MAG: hypothetical protein AAF197_09330, partial [Pseudomonadota bacterium]
RVDSLTDMVAYFAMPDDRTIESQQAHYAFAMASQLNKTTELSLTHQVDPAQLYSGLRSLPGHESYGKASFLSGQSFGSVLTGFSIDANTLGLNYHNESQSGWNAGLGLVSIDENTRFGKESFSTIMEGGYEFADNAGLKLQFGQIQEQGTLFGGAAGGIFGVDTATTYALNITGHLTLGERFTIVGNYGVGRTRVAAAAESLLSEFSSLESDWYSLGVIGNNVFSRSDQLGFSLSQPLKIRSGALDYSIPVARDQFGDIAFDTERINLGASDGTETRVEMYYRSQVSDVLELGSFLSFRDNPNHVRSEPDELVVMLTLRYTP